MESREHEMTFEEADRRYADLKRKHDSGAMSTEEFDGRLKGLMVRDGAGRWWAKSRQTGEWHYNRDGSWIRSRPPYDRGASPDTLPESPLARLLAGGFAPVELIIIPYALAFGYLWSRHTANGSTDLYFLFQLTLHLPCFLLGFFGRSWYTAANLAVLNVVLSIMIWVSALQIFYPSAYLETQVYANEYVGLSIAGAVVALVGFGLRKLLAGRRSEN